MTTKEQPFDANKFYVLVARLAAKRWLRAQQAADLLEPRYEATSVPSRSIDSNPGMTGSQQPAWLVVGDRIDQRDEAGNSGTSGTDV